MKRTYLLFVLALTSLIFLIIFVYFSFNDKKLHIVVCDVGQGDAILITTPNQAQILIDGGPDKSVLDCLSRHMPFWDRSLDAVVLTHPHADHFTGLIDVIERYYVSAFYGSNVASEGQLYAHFNAKLADKNLSAKVLNGKDIVRGELGYQMKVIWPRSNQDRIGAQNESNYDLNMSSVVFLVKYGKFDVLLTGDAESPALDSIISEIPDIDVLKVPHHGSKIGLSDKLLSKSNPELAVISVGSKNKYGHPSKSALDFLTKYKIKVLRTDMNGEIEIISDGKSYYISPD